MKTIIRFHATLLECYVAFVNRVGTEGKGVFWGGSHVLDLAAAGSPRLPCTPGSS